MALINNAPPPLGDPIAQQTRKEFKPGEDPQAGLCSQPWGDWFTSLLAILSKSLASISTVSLTDQDASIATTEIPATQPPTAGLYSIQYYVRLTAVDGISASVEVTFRWTWDGVARSFTGPPLAANNLAETGTGYVLLNIDPNTAISYETQASFGSGDGEYALDFVLSEVDA